jgi:hypothetical protein
MQDVIAALISFFLIEPLQAEMTRTLAAARAPQTIITGVTTCAQAAAPALLARAAGDPGWAATTAVRVWAGWVRPEVVLIETAPQCGPAVDAARPFLAGVGS